MIQKRSYQLHLSQGDTVLKDIEGWTQKFRKILSVLHDFYSGTPPHLKMTRKGHYYCKDHLSLIGLKQLVSKFRIHNYTISIICDPKNIFATDLFNPKSFLYKCVRWLAPFLYPCIPIYIWILTKK